MTATGSVLDHARAKLDRKGCDLLVVNEVGVGVTFGQDENTVHLLRRGSDDATLVGPAPKGVVAHAVWDAVPAPALTRVSRADRVDASADGRDCRITTSRAA